MTGDLGSQANVGQFSTFASWDMKTILLNHYTIAYNSLSIYIVEPEKSQHLKDAQKAIIKMMFPLFPKLYVLPKQYKKIRDYVAYFMVNPDKMGLMDLQAVFLILQRVMEVIGITRFERFQLSETQAYMEE